MCVFGCKLWTMEIGQVMGIICCAALESGRLPSVKFYMALLQDLLLLAQF